MHRSRLTTSLRAPEPGGDLGELLLARLASDLEVVAGLFRQPQRPHPITPRLHRRIPEPPREREPSLGLQLGRDVSLLPQGQRSLRQRDRIAWPVGPVSEDFGSGPLLS